MSSFQRHSRLVVISELLTACVMLSACGGGATDTSPAAAGAAAVAPAPAPAASTADAAQAQGRTPSKAPTYAAPTVVLPGWVAGTYAVGQGITADFGVPAHGATSFTYAFYRNGDAIPGASGTTTSRFVTYWAAPGDSGTIISCRVTPSNSAGTGSTVDIGGIYVD